MKPAAVLLDFDGVVVDTEALHQEATRLAAAQYGAIVSYDELAPFGGASILEGAAYIIAKYELLCAQDEFVQDKSEIFQVLLAKRDVSLMAGVAEFLAYWEGGGVHRALVTNGNMTRDLKPVLKALAPEERRLLRFDVIVTGDMVARRKPSPESYLLAVKMLGVSARQCVAFEDSVPGLHAARSAECYVVGVNRSERRVEGADAWVETLEEALVARPWKDFG